MKPNNIILEGVVGSKAYGLDNANSDEDVLGIYVANTWDMFKLNKPKESIVHTNPDYTYHEIEKYVRLALKANPTILELLFLKEYKIVSNIGNYLIKNRNIFLSNKIYNSYGGYALSQAKRLQRATQEWSRYEKHARHCFRLLQQGKQLLEKGTLDVRVTNKEELFAIAELKPLDLVEKFFEEFEKFDKIKSVLPNKPDYKKANELLISIRKNNV